jgi:hypothetical protein
MLCGIVSCVVLSAAAPAKADDAEDHVVRLLERKRVQITRDHTHPDKPIVRVPGGWRPGLAQFTTSHWLMSSMINS